MDALKCTKCTDVEATIQCPCAKALYCSAQCQKADWGEHRASCPARTDDADIGAPLGLGRLRIDLITTPGTDEYLRFDDAVKGLVLGGAIGDYLGSRVHGLPSDYFLSGSDAAAQLQALMDGSEEVRFQGASWPDLLPGQISAVTETWMVSAQGIMQEPNNADRGVARWLLKWANDADEPPFTIQEELRAVIPRAYTGSAPEGVLRTAAGQAKLTSGAAMVRVSAVSVWNPTDRLRVSTTTRLDREARQNAELTHALPDVKHAAVAYARICASLLWDGNGLQGATPAIKKAREYLQREAPNGAALRALNQAEESARLNAVDRSLEATKQAFAPNGGDPEYVRALYGVVWFLVQGERNPRDQIWSDAVRNAVVSGGNTNLTASLVGAVLGALYGQRALPRVLLGQVLSYDTRDSDDERMHRPQWLRAQRLIHFAEQLGRANT